MTQEHLPVFETTMPKTDEIVSGTIQLLAVYIEPAELVKIQKILPKDIAALLEIKK